MEHLYHQQQIMVQYFCYMSRWFLRNVVGTTYLNGCNYQVGYDLLETKQAEGYHRIRTYGVLNVTNNYISWSRGTARVWDNTVSIGTYYSKGSYTLVSKDVDVYCDSQGHCSVYIDGSLNTTFVSGSTGGTAYLPDIPRYPVLNSGSNFTDRTNPVFNITAYGTYSLRVKLEAGGNTQLITRDLSSRNSQTYTLVLTNEERKTLRRLSPNGKTLAVRETVCAMSGNTELSVSYKDYTMTIVKKPIKVMRNGTWVNAFPYVRVNGEWKEAKPYMRVNGSWKEEK